MFTYLAQNFLLPLIVAVFAGIVLLMLGGVKWSLRKHLLVTVPIVLLAFGICWLVAQGSEPTQRLIVAGRIVNDWNESVSQATVSVSDGREQCTSDDDGNFKLDLTGKRRKWDTVQIRVSKPGYSAFTGTTQVPAEDFIIHLHHP